jgi:acetate kinase
MIYFHSGFLGVYETSSDLKDLLAQETEDTRVADAIRLFYH